MSYRQSYTMSTRNTSMASKTASATTRVHKHKPCLSIENKLQLTLNRNEHLRQELAANSKDMERLQTEIKAQESDDDFEVLDQNTTDNNAIRVSHCPFVHGDGICDCGPYNEPEDGDTSSLYDDLQLARKTILELQNTLENLKAHNGYLTKQMTKRVETISQLKQQVWHNESGNTENGIKLSDELKAVEGQLFESEKRIKDLTTDLELAVAQIAVHEVDFNEERSLREKAVGEKETWKTSCNDLLAENSVLNDNVDLLKAEVKNANQSVDYFKRLFYESQQGQTLSNDTSQLTEQFSKIKVSQRQPVAVNPSAPALGNTPNGYHNIPPPYSAQIQSNQSSSPPFCNKMPHLYEEREQKSSRMSSSNKPKYNTRPKISQMKLRPEFQSTEYKAKAKVSSVHPVHIRVHPEIDGHISLIMGNVGRDEVDADYARTHSVRCAHCGLYFDSEFDLDQHHTNETGSCF